MPAPQKNIGMFGLFGGGNLGNEGSLEAVLQMLRRVQPDARLSCICAKPAVVMHDHGIPALPIRTPPPVEALSRGLPGALWKVAREVIDWPATFLRVRRFGVVIVPGTGILDDFGERPWRTPLMVFRMCVMARLAGTKVWFVSIGAGPIRHPVSRWLMLQAARLAEYRSFRDTGSRDYMKSIGLDTNADEVYPDVAFALPAPIAQSTAGEERADTTTTTIGVGVMAYQGWKGGASGPAVYAGYIDTLTKFVRRLLERGFRVRLIMGET